MGSVAFYSKIINLDRVAKKIFVRKFHKEFIQFKYLMK